MALTRQQRIRLIAEKLVSKNLEAITQAEFTTLVGSLPPGEWAQAKLFLTSGLTRDLGAFLRDKALALARQRAMAEATQAWSDGALSEVEFDRAFE